MNQMCVNVYSFFFSGACFDAVGRAIRKVKVHVMGYT